MSVFVEVVITNKSNQTVEELKELAFNSQSVSQEVIEIEQQINFETVFVDDSKAIDFQDALTRIDAYSEGNVCLGLVERKE